MARKGYSRIDLAAFGFVVSVSAGCLSLCAVACVLNDAPAVLLDLRLDQLTKMPL
jgi:hypothetical protein